MPPLGARKILLLALPLLLAVLDAGAMATHDVVVRRSLDRASASVDETAGIILTVEVENREASALRGFYFVEELPEGLSLRSLSVSISGNPLDKVLQESAPAGAVLAGYIPCRWVLETPEQFLEDTPLPAGQTLRLEYRLNASEAGPFSLDEFHWAGHFVGETAGAFGYSESSDALSIEFLPPPAGAEHWRRYD